MTQGKPHACALRIGQRRGRSACTCAWALRVRCTRQGSPPTPLTRQSTPAAAPRCWQTGGHTRPPWREVRNLRSCSGTLSPRMAKAHHQRVRSAPFSPGVPDHLIRRPVPQLQSPSRRSPRVATRAPMFATPKIKGSLQGARRPGASVHAPVRAVHLIRTFARPTAR